MIDWTLHIAFDPEKLYCKPVIIHTRIPVYLILEKLAVGDTIDDLIEVFPHITKDDIAACLIFAADSIKKEIVRSKAL